MRRWKRLAHPSNLTHLTLRLVGKSEPAPPSYIGWQESTSLAPPKECYSQERERLHSPMCFRHCFVQALLLALRFDLAFSVDASNLGRCQKSGCRTAPDDGHLRHRRAAPRQTSALVVEWTVVFSLMAWVFSGLKRLLSRCLPWRRQATASKTAGSSNEACVGILRRASAGRSPQSTASLESLMDLIGSDGESELDLSATYSCSSESTCASKYTISNIEAASACIESSSEANTAPRSAARAAAGKRGPKDGVCSNRSVPSTSSTPALASEESRSSSGYDASDSYRTEYVYTESITSRSRVLVPRRALSSSNDRPSR